MSESANGENSQDILKLEEEISNFFEDFMYDRGGSPLLGRIYALCVLTGAKFLEQFVCIFICFFSIFIG